MEEITLLEDILQTIMTKQLKIAIKKEIVPRAQVVLDKDEK